MSLRDSTDKLVKINADDVDTIDRLYGIGPELAKRIVQFRTDHGYFQSPADLEKVPGIGVDRIQTLITKIDWSIPSDEPERTNIEWFSFAIFAFSGYFTFLGLWKGMVELFELHRLWGHINLPPLRIATTVLEPLSFLPGLFGWLFLAVSSLTTSRKLDRRFYRIGLRLLITAFLFFALKGTFWALRYSINDGWGEFFSNPVNIRAVQGFIIGAWTALPIAFLLFNWRLSKSPVLEKVHTVGLIVQAPLLLAFALYWGTDAVSGVVEIIVRLLSAGIGLWTGFLILNGDVPFKSLVRSLGLTTDSPARYFEAWIEKNLPKVEDQIELRDLLNRKYPRTFARTFFGVIVLSVSGWLILTVLGGVIEWLVGNFMDRLIGK